MNQFDQKIQEGEIKLAMKMCSTVKWVRIFLAATIAFAYFSGFSWAMDVVIFSVILLLAAPLGFFDVFIQKLVEYNTSTLEYRIRLNAEESNRAFTDINKRIRGGRGNDA